MSIGITIIHIGISSNIVPAGDDTLVDNILTEDEGDILQEDNFFLLLEEVDDILLENGGHLLKAEGYQLLME